MTQEFETSIHNFASRSKALKELFMGKDDFSHKYTAQQNTDNTWAISGDFYHFSNKLLADELDTNRMLDLMIGLELGYHSDNRSINSILREQKDNPNHIVKLYQQEVEAGRYEPTIMLSRALRTPKTTDATIIVEMRDNDLLSQIKEDSLSEAEKISKIHNLSQLIATKNSDGTWDLHSLNDSISALKGNLSMDEAIEMMAAVEEKKNVQNISLPKNMVHHFSQVASFDKPFQATQEVKPTPKTAVQENGQDIHLKAQKIESNRGGTFNFNLN